VDDREVGGGLARGNARVTVDDESSRSDEEILGGRQAGWRGGGGWDARVANGERETERGRERGRMRGRERRSGRSRGEEGTTASASVLRRGRGPGDERVVPDYRARDGASAGSDAADTSWRLLPSLPLLPFLSLLVPARPVREGAMTLKILSGKYAWKFGAPIFTLNQCNSITSLLNLLRNL